jgi:acetate kinase
MVRTCLKLESGHGNGTIDFTMKILVINSGSSSIKYKVFNAENSALLAYGMLERIGEPDSHLKHFWQKTGGKYDEITYKKFIRNHHDGFEWIISVTIESDVLRDEKELFGIGHRVVHGGEIFHEPTLIDNAVIVTLRKLIPLAPIHNPENILSIEIAFERFPHVPQVAVFDTSFHQTMPQHAYHYALPYELYRDYHVRRYGFHGTSHYYVAKHAASYLGKSLDTLNLITLHLGNGASAAAIRAGKSIDTSMGMTPLEGLIMGTRSGDLDPAILLYLARTTGKSIDELESLLNEQSGLKGICGVNDMREVERLAESGDVQARLAIDMFCYRIKKYIGAYYSALGHVDATVFTGGIGENSPLIRKNSCEGLSGLGISIDDKKNETAHEGIFEIQENKGTIKILVIPTDEELEIALQTVKKIKEKFT